MEGPQKVLRRQQHALRRVRHPPHASYLGWSPGLPLPRYFWKRIDTNRKACVIQIVTNGWCIRWIQASFTVERPGNDSGATFRHIDSRLGPKVRATAQKSELQTKSQSYSWPDPPNPNRVTQKRNPNGV